MQASALWIGLFVRESKNAINGNTLIEAFSSSPEEVYLRFEHIAWKLQFENNIAYVFPITPEHLPQKNRQPLFKEAWNQKVLMLEDIPAERAFQLKLAQHLIQFRCFGTQSDVLLYRGETPLLSFRHRYNKNKALPGLYDGLKQEHNNIRLKDWAKRDKGFALLPASFFALYPEDEQRNANAWQEEAFNFIQAHALKLHSPEGEPPSIEFRENDGQQWIGISAKYYRAYFRFLHRKKQEKQIRSDLAGRLKKTRKQLQKLQQEQERFDEQNYRLWADNIMASLHLLNKGMEHAKLLDIYSHEPLRIPLKVDLSPQENATRYYRKAKRQHIEKEKLEEQIFNLLEAEELLVTELEKLEQGKFSTVVTKSKKESTERPAHSKLKTYQMDGYLIRVGKNAEGNDELLRISHKNDYWLHARQMKGAHVSIACGNAWEKVGNKIKENAAGLAAWYSDGKGSALVPVIISQRKYVRKKKGLHAGQVIVDREEVILVEPLHPSKLPNQ